MNSSRTLATCLLFAIASVLLTGAQPTDAEGYLSLAQRQVTVDCPKQSVGRALELAADNWPFGRVTITVRGVCVEEVIISRDETTLRGALPGDGLQAPSPASTVLMLSGHKIDLQQLTLIGGSTGLLATDGASFSAKDLRVSETVNGVYVEQNAIGDLSNSWVENTYLGVVADTGGVLRMFDGMVDTSTASGVQTSFGGHVSLYDGAVIRNSRHVAVVANWGGSIDISDATVEHNDLGVYALGGGHVNIRDGSVIQNNVRGGVAADGGSTVGLSGGARVNNNGGSGVGAGDGSCLLLGDVVIEHNGNDGISVGGGATARFSGGTIVQNNIGHGIALGAMSAAVFYDGTVQVIGNTGTAVICFPGSVAQIVGAPGTISGNGSDAIDCSQTFP